jgi:acyl carrier protein
MRGKDMTIEEQIKEYISRNLLFSNNGFPYSDEDSFTDQGIVDSLGIMVLVAFVEDNFKLSVEDWEITPMNFDSVARLAVYVRSKMKLAD